MTLLEAIKGFNVKIQVTDRQETTISSSIENLKANLLNPECELNAEEVFLNGSYERDTIIRPLDDIDLFLVLDEDKYFEEGMLPEPRNVLQKIKSCLSKVPEYKDKVIKDDPCITIELSKHSFDVLPSFQATEDIYYIPTYDLSGWTTSQPTQLTNQLNEINKRKNFLVKPIVRSVKKWNVINGKFIPSFHIEEIAINILSSHDFANHYDGILYWFENARRNFDVSKFKDQQTLDKALKIYDNALITFQEADKEYKNGNENRAIVLWKSIFGIDFPTIEEEESKNYSKALTEGNLKIMSTGALSTSTGITAAASKGFFGDEN